MSLKIARRVHVSYSSVYTASFSYRVSFHHHLITAHLHGCPYGIKHPQILRTKRIRDLLQITCTTSHRHTTIISDGKAPTSRFFLSFRKALYMLIFKISGGGLDHLSFCCCFCLPPICSTLKRCIKKIINSMAYFISRSIHLLNSKLTKLQKLHRTTVSHSEGLKNIRLWLK